MLNYCLSRLGQLILMLFLASVVIFAVIQNTPGDPALIRLGTEATPEQVEMERVRLGLHRTLPERYAIWLGDAARLDFGKSFSTGLPVSETIADAFAQTLKLASLAALIGLVFGTALGITAALNRGRWLDNTIAALTAVAFSLPSFALGTLLVIVFAVTLRWLPPSGLGNSSNTALDTLRFLIMPAVTLAMPFIVVLARYVRTSLIEALQQDYVTTARAKGLSRRTIVITHALRNALIPTVTIAGLQIGNLLAGATVTETVFSYPGLGRLIIEAVTSLDYPLVQGALLFTATVFLLCTFLVDLAYGLIDPRIRTAGG
ncbi:ABC transporter permease [Bosea sp. BK604]|uniref:ABC transporter permease n=1 Tax=Bosea sp. BK604 TaxID=2512180 RepID=UPI0010500132|nr:ABC transporter permease [Bosea sp. BK604]TCR65269.1 peptide/nickel transport system permease protein/oligopeptide transport system permease protein [Bosea sp. BK604]